MTYYLEGMRFYLKNNTFKINEYDFQKITHIFSIITPYYQEPATLSFATNVISFACKTVLGTTTPAVLILIVSRCSSTYLFYSLL